MKTVKTKIVILGIICAFVSACVCGSVSLMRTQAITNQNAEQIMSMQCENSGQEINATLVRVARQYADDAGSYEKIWQILPKQYTS